MVGLGLISTGSGGTSSEQIHNPPHYSTYTHIYVFTAYNLQNIYSCTELLFTPLYRHI